MELCITETQLKMLVKNSLKTKELDEQESPVNPEPKSGTSDKQTGASGYPEVGKWESGINRGPANQIGVTKWSDVVGVNLKRSKANQLKEQSSYEKAIWDKSTQTLNRMGTTYEPVVNFYQKYNHEINQVSALALGLMGGPVGFVVAMGLGFLDSKQYYDEGDKKTAGLIALFSGLPGLGKIVTKIPYVKKLGVRGMAELGKRLSMGKKITNPKEIEIISKISQYKSLIQSEMNKLGQQTTSKLATQSVRSNLKKQAIKKGVSKLGKDLAISSTIGYGYGKLYDYEERKKEDDNLKKLNQLLGIK